ncbi:MAG TPA: exo-alpha-sialidase [Kofleriaceae bacterium]|nr:exo-alpha-sialidase [Kofleriaceae bacterium]
MHELLLSTRKGLFVAQPQPGGAGYEVTRGAFVGDNVTLVLVADDGTWYAALDHGHFGVKLHRSDDRGAAWTEIATPQYPPQPESEPAKPKWSTSLVWALATAHDHDGALWCGTLPGGLFRSDDRGATWRLNEALWFHPSRKKWNGGGRDDPGIHSIVVNPRDPNHVVVAVSSGGVWRTRDGGASWHTCAKGMRAEYMPPELAYDTDIQDPHAVVQCAMRPNVWWCQHHNGIFRSTDDLESWQEITGVKPSAFGFPVVVDPFDGDTAWFIPAIKDEKRIPVDGRLVVTRTRDGGKTFETLSKGLPDRFAYDLVYRHAFSMAGDGTLAFGSTTGNAFFSRDRGDSWTVVSHHLPPIHAVTFSVAR